VGPFYIDDQKLHRRTVPAGRKHDIEKGPKIATKLWQTQMAKNSKNLANTATKNHRFGKRAQI
jgi:hypothetical protein